MNEQKKKLFLIKIAYWLGIAADAVWTVALLFPRIFGIITGSPDFDPDLQIKLIMGIGGILMFGWTILLVWAVKEPIERRFVIILTSVVVAGLFVVALISYLAGNTGNIWILIKNPILFLFMVISYTQAQRIEKASLNEL